MKNLTVDRLIHNTIFSGFLVLAFCVTGFGQLATTSVFMAGLSQPAEIIQTHLGNFVVSETFGAPNSGQISIIDEWGYRRVLVSGLPSGISPEGPSGASGLAMRGRRLYVAIGQGDGILPGPIPGTMVPNPNPSSPVLSSVLWIEFSPKIETYGQGFSLSPADHAVIANGGVVWLRNGNMDWITIGKVADFPNSVPNPIPPFQGNVRQSNPFGLAVKGDDLYVTDGGMNSVVHVDLYSGSVRTLTVFPPRRNPTPIGSPVIEAVPTGIRVDGDQLLVTLFTGFPFVPGQSEVRTVSRLYGTHSFFIGGRSSAIDVLESNNQMFPHLVLEFSTNMLQNQPGRLLAFEETYYPPYVVAGGLISPSGMVRDKKSGDIFITEIFTGRIIRVQLPPWLS